MLGACSSNNRKIIFKNNKDIKILKKLHWASQERMGFSAWNHIEMSRELKAKKQEFVLRIHSLGESHLADWWKYKPDS